MTGELQKQGLRLRLQEKPLQILLALLERPGEVVTREQLVARLWPPGTFVDFDLALNAAMRRLRDLLSDSAESPRYIETLPRLGYRFIAPVEVVAPAESAARPGPDAVRGAESRRRWSIQARAGLAAAAFLLAFSVVFGAWRARHAQSPLAFSQRDWVIISQFENRTGDASLEGSLETLLERELSNSRYVNVVPANRARDTLRLMRRSEELRPSLAAAREVAVRDGGIKAVIAGRAERIGGRFLLGVSVVLPDGVTVGSYTEEAGSDGEIVPAMRRLAGHVREQLGEQLADVRRSDKALERVTTPSLPALQLYSRANSLMQGERPAQQDEAAGLLQRALAAEPDFASAHVLLAYAMDNSGKHKGAMPHFRRAFELAGTVTERERLFIEASYFDMVEHDLARAQRAYESLLALYPDDYWTVNNLGPIYESTGKAERVSKLVLQRADLRPNDFNSNYVAWRYLLEDNERVRARQYCSRALRLVTPEVKHSQPAAVADLEAAPLNEALARGDLKEALRQLQRLRERALTPAVDLEKEIAAHIVVADIVLGRLRDAAYFAESLSDPGLRAYARVGVAEARQDRLAMRAALQEQVRLDAEVGPNTVCRLARVGLTAQAEHVLRLKSPGWPYPAYVDFVRGEIALAQGRRAQALPSLQAAVAGFREHRSKYLVLSALALARALEEAGKEADAIAVLQSVITANPGLSGTYFTNQARIRLANLYRAQGSVAEAEKLEEEVRQTLVFADPDHPLLRALPGVHSAGMQGKAPRLNHQRKQGS